MVDETFLSESKLRFEQEHRLLFIPSLVIDSKGLLTGSSQALELSNSLSMRTSNFSGLENISISNGTLQWNSTVGDRVSVWRTDAVLHESRNRTHPTLQPMSCSSTFNQRMFLTSMILKEPRCSSKKRHVSFGKRLNKSNWDRPL